ncbi:MAG: extracellular solute-binding protein [Arenimonas sp.]
MTGVAQLRNFALIASLCAAVCACTGGDRAPAAPGVQAGTVASHAREGQLDVLARAQVPAPGGEGIDWARAFESDTGCIVKLHSAPSAAELLALAIHQDADLVFASGDIAGSLVESGRVRPIDARRFPMLAQMDPRLRDTPGAVVEGRRYALPWRWQPNVLVYDTGIFPEAPRSWSTLFDPAPASAALAPARLLASSEPIAIADAALYLATARPELRIADPYALDERQYAATLALLRRLQPALRGRWTDAASQFDGFRNGVVASASTPAQVRMLQAQGLPVAWTLPEEGGSAEVEFAMLHAGARHPNCAQAWLQWSLTPPAQAVLAARAGALPVLPAACALPPLAGADACARDGMALLPRLQPWRLPQARCDGGRCVPYSRWTHDYLALASQ